MGSWLGLVTTGKQHKSLCCVLLSTLKKANILLLTDYKIISKLFNLKTEKSQKHSFVALHKKSLVVSLKQNGR